MCLSRVYLKEVDDGSLVVDEASRIFDNNGTVEVNTLFGEEKKLEGYTIGEVNMMENYVILRKMGV